MDKMTLLFKTIILISLPVMLITIQVEAQFGLPIFPGFGLPPQPQPPTFNGPFRFPSRIYGENSFGSPIGTAPSYNSWPFPPQYGSNRYISRPPSPARQCRTSGACKQIDYGTTLSPTAKMISTTPPPVASAPTTMRTTTGV